MSWQNTRADATKDAKIADLKSKLKQWSDHMDEKVKIADNPVSEARTTEYYKKRPCVELVKSAAKIMEDYLEEKQE